MAGSGLGMFRYLRSSAMWAAAVTECDEQVKRAVVALLLPNICTSPRSDASTGSKGRSASSGRAQPLVTRPSGRATAAEPT